MPRHLICDSCGQPTDTLNEADMCPECHEAWANAEAAHWFPLYQAEREMRTIYEELGIDPENFKETDL